MRIDHYLPQIVAARSTVQHHLMRSLAAAGETPNDVAEIVGALPRELGDADAFLDRWTGLWRYEFGEPFVDGADLIIGSNTWPPVESLRLAIQAIWRHLPPAQRAPFLARLSLPAKHLEVLAEMMPAHRIGGGIASMAEVRGLGPGNTDVDWSFQPAAGPLILVEVKSRVLDFLHQAGRADVDGQMPAPAHNHDAMFKSVQSKFNDADPDIQLQGCWISSFIKQNSVEINRAFEVLDQRKVHFAILGDWEQDATILTRREADKQVLLQTFGLVPSNRFVYTPI